MKLRFLLTGIALGFPISLWAMPQSSYNYVMMVVQNRDLSALQRIVASGVNLNSPRADGKTPLCEAVEQQDYQGYEMLTSQGATPYVSCMRQLPPSTVQTFYANQPPAHTYYVGYMQRAQETSVLNSPSLGIPLPNAGEILLGGIATGVAFAVNNSGNSKKHNIVYKWDTPLSLSPSEFSSTDEYQAQPSTWEGSVNFLGGVKAADAYARGYTGYKVKRKNDGTLIGSGEEAISAEKVKVAVVDEGVWTNHPDLKANVATGGTYNFVYGPCKSGTTGKCWDIYEDPADGVGYYIYLKNASKTVLRYIAKETWNFYLSHYQNYNYVASDAAPTSYTAWTAMTTSGKTMYLPRYKSADKWYIMYDSVAYEVTCSDSPETCLAGTFNYFGYEIPLSTGTEYMNHGTHVSGLIAATKNNEGMMGVAYNAEIIPIKADMDMQYSVNLISEAVSAGADIVNLSIGTVNSLANTVAQFDSTMLAYPDVLEGYRSAARANKILVFAAGNYSEGSIANSSMYSLAPLSNYFNGTTPDAGGTTYNLKNLFVNVVSMNDTLTDLAAYSARCGDTMAYCVGAPGGTDSNIYSTVNTSEGYGYEGMMGTSMATPIVSGSLAVIKSAFPHLTNQQVVQILFETASYIDPTAEQKAAATNYIAGSDALGNYNSIFGRGVVNLEAATNPIGLKQINLTSAASGPSVPASSSEVSLPYSFERVKAGLPRKIVVLDKYARAFQMPTSSFVHVSKRQNKLEGRFHSFVAGNDKVVQNDAFQMSYSERHSKLNSSMKQGSVHMLFKPSEKLGFKAFYSENTETSGGKYFDRLLASPYGHMKEAWGAGFSMALGKHWLAEMSGQVGQNGYVDEKDLKHMDRNKMSLFQSSLVYKGLGPISLKTVAGVSKEQGSVLGMWGRGAFKSGNSNTAYIGAGMTINLTDSLTVDGMYYYGKTQVSNQTALLKLSNLTSDSFAVTASWHVDERRLLGLQFVSPLKIRRGVAEIDLPVARDAYQDVVYRQKAKADLQPTAREYDIGLYYADELSKAMLFQTEMGVRLNPDHVKGAAPDWRALVGLSMDM